MNKYYLILFLLFISFLSMAQEEKITVEHTEEKSDKEEFSKLAKAYNYIVRSEVEEIKLFKIDLLSSTLYSLAGSELGDTTNIDVFRFSFEKKIEPEWSWIIRASMEANNEFVTNIILGGGGRFYYNMDKRIVQGKSANNFSANYIGSEINIQNKPKTDDFASSLKLFYGMQRRLGKRGYFDFNWGFEYAYLTFSDSSPDLFMTGRIELGLAF